MLNILLAANEVKDNKEAEKKNDGSKESSLDPDALARVRYFIINAILY